MNKVCSGHVKIFCSVVVIGGQRKYAKFKMVPCCETIESDIRTWTVRQQALYKIISMYCKKQAGYGELQSSHGSSIYLLTNSIFHSICICLQSQRLSYL